MQVFGFTLNLLTLLAIVLSVGLVVDDAIVVVENVERHIREGKTPLEAALVGARELVGPVIAMTITLAAVYAPIGFQGGLTGALFREFAFTLAGAVFISGIVALTLSPMMSSRLARAVARQRLARRGRSTAASRRSGARYERALAATLRNRAQRSTPSGSSSPSLVVPLYMRSRRTNSRPTKTRACVFGRSTCRPNATSSS